MTSAEGPRSAQRIWLTRLQLEAHAKEQRKAYQERMVSVAAQALELFGDDDLEDFARRQDVSARLCAAAHLEGIKWRRARTIRGGLIIIAILSLGLIYITAGMILHPTEGMLPNIP